KREQSYTETKEGDTIIIFLKYIKVLLNPGPCIHYIWSSTVHRTWKCNYFSKYKLLNTFFHQQLEQSCDYYQCPAEHMLKIVGGVFFLFLEEAEPQ
ncbi:unnamed protein product, partial [Staurois parvus]